jgi:CheY-like chemotaxis protein
VAPECRVDSTHTRPPAASTICATEQALADLKATQEQLVRGQTLRALGEMASGAAHHQDEVREVIALLLEAEGHTVEQVGAPLEALDRLASGPRPDVVLTDLCMPQMTGWEVACAVKERWPEITVGLVTGWGDNPAPTSRAQEAVDFTIGKPVDMGAIRGCLLNRRSAAAPRMA